MTGFWKAIDWQRPWLSPYRGLGMSACALLDAQRSVAEALNELAQPAPRLAAGSLRFVAQHELAPDEAYESFIARTGCVPTRDNLHDLFNGLVWLVFPQIKRRLNELQAEQIAQMGVRATRGSVRDALTLFDENAALWQMSEAMFESLRSRDWSTLFITRRVDWSDARLTLFGHALLEKLVMPRKAITAHVWPVTPGADLDSFALNELRAERLAAKPWLPLPVLGVLGVPGWWSENESPMFYDDRHVFRVLARMSKDANAGCRSLI
ncbi:MAG: DUF3025 domain-containing protein [Burkholderiales bacterium]|nr:DUF3025 domain-containing protein [Burkholderiales bacterium]